MERKLLRQLMKYTNRLFMVPALRLGLGWMIGSPFGGYVMLLRTTGRKSGKLRYTPVNYAIAGGDAYCLAGFGKGTDWLDNILADPHVEVRLPTRTLQGTAEQIGDRELTGQM